MAALSFPVPDDLVGRPLSEVVEVSSGRSAADVVEAFTQGRVVSQLDAPLRPDLRAKSGQVVFVHRRLPEEVEPPAMPSVLAETRHLLIVDKPHFVAVTPQGQHVRYSALAYLRELTGNRYLTPVHRLDRMTAGVMLFSTNPSTRGAFQRLFAEGTVSKEYQAIVHDGVQGDWPRQRRSKIVKLREEMQAKEVTGPVNAVTEFFPQDLVTCIDACGGSSSGDSAADLRLVRLLPHTGKTHQLRVHLNAIGAPILGDPLYPDVLEYPDPVVDESVFDRPMKLLARKITFPDPITGRETTHESQLTLT